MWFDKANLIMQQVGYPDRDELIIGTNRPSSNPQESSPYFPAIPDSVAFSATEDVSQKYEQQQIADERIDFHSGKNIFKLEFYWDFRTDTRKDYVDS